MATRKIYITTKTKKEQAMLWSQALVDKTPLKEHVKQPTWDAKSSIRKLETEAQRAIIDELDFHMKRGELFYQRTNTTGIYDASRSVFRSLGKGVHEGFPDILVVKLGRIIFIEVKSNSGDQSHEQVVMQEQVERQGAEYYVLRGTSRLEEILKGEDLH